MFFHWQNLNERRRGSTTVHGTALKHGRAWLHFGGQGRRREYCLRTEWHFGGFRFHIGFDLDGGDREVLAYFVVPLFGLYLGLEGLRWPLLWALVGNTTRAFGVSVHGWHFWWNFGQDQMSSTGKEPRWMHWVFDIPRFFFGKLKYEKVVLEKKRIEIPLPEGVYLAEAEFQTCTWKRARWPWRPLKRVRDYTEVNVLQYGGLPFEGKGENSWDCGTDGLYGYSSEGHDYIGAISEGAKRTLENRKRYGGAERGYYRNPVVDKPEGLAPFARYLARCQQAEDEHPRWPQSTVRFDLEGDLVHIIHQREGRPQLLTVTKDVIHYWKGALEEARRFVAAESRDSCAEAGG